MQASTSSSLSVTVKILRKSPALNSYDKPREDKITYFNIIGCDLDIYCTIRIYNRRHFEKLVQGITYHLTCLIKKGNNLLWQLSKGTANFVSNINVPETVISAAPELPENQPANDIDRSIADAITSGNAHSNICGKVVQV